VSPARVPAVTDAELDAAAEVAAALSVDCDFDGALPPAWLYDALRDLPHLGYRRVEGVWVQRGPYASGGFRLATETEAAHLVVFPPRAYWRGLPGVLPKVAVARQLRLLREGLGAQAPGEEVPPR
jgi:hypothetical protein